MIGLSVAPSPRACLGEFPGLTCCFWHSSVGCSMAVERLREELLRRVASPLVAEAIFDRTPDIVFFMKNARGQYVVVNRTLAERCGFAHKEALIGKTTRDVFPPQLADRYADQDRLVLETGSEITDTLELHLYRDRTPGWCLTSKFPLRGNDGSVVGMAGISKDLHEPNARASVYPEIARAVEHVQAHFAEPLRVEDLAALAGLSPARLERNIRAIFQITVGQLIGKTRIDHAAGLLRSSETTVAEVAHACGFYDHSAFSRQFKAAVGVTPSEYRALSARTHAVEKQS
ncbi:AraC family transcriptional regulator [bacterium]|nr:MAG: AraC family transcriptional regulator [bacterium]